MISLWLDSTVCEFFMVFSWDSWWVFAGLSFGRESYGGIGLVGKKGRPQFHVAVACVATDIGSVEEVSFSILAFSFPN
jgi:hypothetical protein